MLKVRCIKFIFVQFADDTGIAITGKNIKYISETANRELIFISKWYMSIINLL